MIWYHLPSVVIKSSDQFQLPAQFSAPDPLPASSFFNSPPDLLPVGLADSRDRWALPDEATSNSPCQTARSKRKSMQSSAWDDRPPRTKSTHKTARKSTQRIPIQKFKTIFSGSVRSLASRSSTPRLSRGCDFVVEVSRFASWGT